MKYYISIFCSLFFIFSAHAGDFQSIQALKNEIEAHIKSNAPQQHWEDIEIRVENVDPRLHLKSCSKAGIEVFNPYSTPLMQTNTMGVRCLDPESHWTLYVPIQIIWYKAVVVAKKVIQRGDMLRPSLLGLEKMDINTLRQGYYTDIKPLDGYLSKFNLRSGMVISPTMIRVEKIIKRGNHVAIEAKNKSFSVRMQGEAMSDGALGDVIRVKNTSSKRIIQAKIVGRHVVRVTA